MSIGAHGVDDTASGEVQLDEDVAGVSVLGVGSEVKVESFAVAQAQESDSSAAGELKAIPERLGGKRSSALVVNQPNQVEFAGHGAAKSGAPGEIPTACS